MVYKRTKRLDNYFRDEIISSKGNIRFVTLYLGRFPELTTNLVRHYYYEKEAMIYGFYEDGWKFGLKDRGRNNGYSIRMENFQALCCKIENAKFPL